MSKDDTKLLQLEEYRAQALEQLVSMSDYLVANEDADYATIIALARSTGNTQLLGKALEKIQAIEDQQERSEALLSFLDEVEYEIADSVAPEDAQDAGQRDTSET